MKQPVILSLAIAHRAYAGVDGCAGFGLALLDLGLLLLGFGLVGLLGGRGLAAALGGAGYLLVLGFAVAVGSDAFATTLFVLGDFTLGLGAGFLFGLGACL